MAVALQNPAHAVGAGFAVFELRRVSYRRHVYLSLRVKFSHRCSHFLHALTFPLISFLADKINPECPQTQPTR
jgi:hypothetical protein